MSHPKNTTAPPSVQHHQKPECRYEIDLDCIFSPMWLRLRVIQAGNCIFVSPPLFQKAVAVELFEMLAPHFSGCKFLLSETAGITREPEEFQRLADEHKELIVSLRNDANPGQGYLSAQGFAPQIPTSSDHGAAKEVAYVS